MQHKSKVKTTYRRQCACKWKSLSKLIYSYFFLLLFRAFNSSFFISSASFCCLLLLLLVFSVLDASSSCLVCFLYEKNNNNNNFNFSRVRKTIQTNATDIDCHRNLFIFVMSWCRSECKTININTVTHIHAQEHNNSTRIQKQQKLMNDEYIKKNKLNKRYGVYWNVEVDDCRQMKMK